MALDQIDLAIISQALIAAAKEMGIKLVRSAYSPIVREGERLLRRAARRRGQRGEPGGAHPDAARPHRDHLPSLCRALSSGYARRRRLLHQQRPFSGRTARPRRVHFLPHLFRPPPGGIQRDRRPSPRSRGRRARSQHGGGRRPPGGPHLSAEPLQREPGLERRPLRAPGAGQRAGAGEDHRGLQRAVRGQRGGGEARHRALREVRGGCGNRSDVGAARLLRAAHAPPRLPRLPTACTTARTSSTATA